MPSVRFYDVGAGSLGYASMEHLPRKGEIVTFDDLEADYQEAWEVRIVDHFIQKTKAGLLDAGASVGIRRAGRDYRPAEISAGKEDEG